MQTWEKVSRAVEKTAMTVVKHRCWQRSAQLQSTVTLVMYLAIAHSGRLQTMRKMKMCQPAAI
jgi:hypothetical protein